MPFRPEELIEPTYEKTPDSLWHVYLCSANNETSNRRETRLRDLYNKQNETASEQDKTKIQSEIDQIRGLPTSHSFFNYRKKRREMFYLYNAFAYFNGQIYTLLKEPLGVGGYGKVRLGVSKTGEVRAFKSIKNTTIKEIPAGMRGEQVELDEPEFEKFVRNLQRVMGKTGGSFSVARETIKVINQREEKKPESKYSLRRGPPPPPQSMRSAHQPKPKVIEFHKVIIMSDYAGEKCLRKYINSKSLPLIEKIIIMLRACLEVEKVQRINEVHRDIKAGNFRITLSQDDPEFFLLRLIDFDFSEEIIRQNGFVKKKDEILGTPGYIPPEANKKGEVFLNRKTDVFSLGAMCELDLDISSGFVEGMLETDPDKRISLLEATNSFWKGAAEEYHNQGVNIDAKKHLKEAFSSILRMNLMEAILQTVKKIQDAIYFLYKPENDLAFIELQNLAKVYSNTFTLSGYEEEKKENADECERIIILMKRFLQVCWEDRAKNPIGNFSPVVNELFNRVGDKSLQETLGIDLGDPNHPFSCLKHYVDIFSATHEEALEFERIFRSTFREEPKCMRRDSDSSHAASSKASSSEVVSVESVELENTRTTEKLSM